MNQFESVLLDNGTTVFWGIFLYLAVISILSVIVTMVDKRYSRQPRHPRVPEATLLLYAAFGGSVAMLATMLFIRHKTKHIKFMLGLPLIILFQAVVAVWITVYLL